MLLACDLNIDIDPNNLFLWLHATSGVWPNSSEQLTYLPGLQNSDHSSVLSLNKLSGNNWLKIKIFYMTFHSFLSYMAKVNTDLFGACWFCHLTLLCSSKPRFLCVRSSPSSQVHAGEAKSQALQLAAPMPLAPPDMLGQQYCWHWHHSSPLDTGCYWSNQCGSLPSPNMGRFICHLTVFMPVYVTSSRVWSWGLAEPCSCIQVLITTLFGEASFHSL